MRVLEGLWRKATSLFGCPRNKSESICLRNDIKQTYLILWSKRLLTIVFVKDEVESKSFIFLELRQPFHSDKLGIRIHLLVLLQVQMMLPLLERTQDKPRHLVLQYISRSRACRAWPWSCRQAR